MTDPQPPAKLDVFLSYKREEKDIAEALANYLITKGYDVWWDAALLAGEDFAKIVHAELVQARAVVVLWSKQSRASHWVRAEAALALANGTLINAVIDDMAFEGIPPEFSGIQAVRRKASTGTFHKEIAAAIARKGTQPSLQATSAAGALTALADKVKDADFFRMIADSQHPGDYEEYLEKFGEHGQFAGLARRRIAALQKTEAAKRGLWARMRENGAVLGTFLAGLAALAAVLTYLGFSPKTDPTPQPDPGEITDKKARIDDPVTPDPMNVDVITADPPTIGGGDSLFGGDGTGSQAAKVLEEAASRVVLLETGSSGLSNRTEGTVTWTAGSPGNYHDYVGEIAFATGSSAQVTFDAGLRGSTPTTVNLTYDNPTGPLEDFDTITGIRVGDLEIPAEPAPVLPGKALPLSGTTDGSFDKLLTAGTMTLLFTFTDGSLGTLDLPKTPNDQRLLFALFPPEIAFDMDVLGGKIPAGGDPFLSEPVPTDELGTYMEALQSKVKLVAADGTSTSGTVSWSNLERPDGVPTWTATIDLGGLNPAILTITNPGTGPQIRLQGDPVLVPALTGYTRMTGVGSLAGTPSDIGLVFNVDPAMDAEAIKSFAVSFTLDIKLEGPDGQAATLQVPTGGGNWPLLQQAMVGNAP